MNKADIDLLNTLTPEQSVLVGRIFQLAYDKGYSDGSVNYDKLIDAIQNTPKEQTYNPTIECTYNAG